MTVPIGRRVRATTGQEGILCSVSDFGAWTLIDDADTLHLMSDYDGYEEILDSELTRREAAVTANTRRYDAQLLLDSLTIEEVAAHAGLTFAQIDQAEREGQLLAVRSIAGDITLYPAWQFDESVRPLLPALRAANPRLDADSLHAVMTNPAAGDGTAPLDLLRAGKLDLVCQILAAAGEMGA